MTSIVYKLIAERVLPKEPGAVIEIQGGVFEDERYGPGVIFWCPCGERRIVARTPPHKSITFDEQKRLTIKDSLGAHPKPPEYPNDNWCHSHMVEGRFELCDDVICPGVKR